MLKKALVLVLFGLFALPVEMLAGSRKRSRQQSRYNRQTVQAQAQAEKADRARREEPSSVGGVSPVRFPSSPGSPEEDTQASAQNSSPVQGVSPVDDGEIRLVSSDSMTAEQLSRAVHDGDKRGR